MRWLTIVFLLLVLFIIPAQAQAQEEVFLPMIISCYDADNSWRLIKPAGSENRVLNPSAEIAGNFAALGAATATRVTTYQKYGLYSYRAETAGDNEGISFTLLALSNANHYVTIRVRGTLPAAWDWSLDNVTYSTPKLIEKVDSSWNLYGLHVQAPQANGSTTLHVRQNGAGSGDFNLDGVQVEPMSATLTTWTTYIDGTQQGSEWNGAAHASTSTRSAESRAGGISQDFFEEYNFQIRKITGAGAASRRLRIDEYATLPGGELNNIKVQSRRFTIIGKFIANSEEELHQKRQELETELLETSYVNNQSFRIRFNGAEVQKEIAGHYAGGLEGNLAAFYGDIEIVSDEEYMKHQLFTENASIQFDAPNPYWQEVGESAILLDTNDSATFRIVAARLRSTGQWDDLGPPDALGTYTRIFAIAEDETYIYLGGNFLNFNNIAAADYIVRYEKSTGTFSALGAGLNDLVQAIEIASNGDVIIGGNFTNAGGVGAADYLTRWDGAAYNAVGAPNVGAAVIVAVQSLTFDNDGNLYIGGFYQNWADIAAADYIVMWDGAAYSALGSGANNAVTALAVRKTDNRLFLGGLFTNFDGTGAERIAQWDGTNGAVVGTAAGMDLNCNALAALSDGRIIAGGDFVTAGEVTVNRIAIWNGETFISLGGGMSGPVDSISIAPDGTFWVVGDFITAGDISTPDHLARWNGYAWVHYDFSYPFTTNADVFASQFTDPVIEQIYDVWLGFDISDTGNYAGLITVNNEGTAIAFPKIVFNRVGGTTATIQTVINERTSDELFFDYDLLDGETLTIDLSPTKKSIVSSQFGSRLDAILANSDFGEWSLLTGDNDITSFVRVTGAPTITAHLLWRDSYDGYN